jgi:hypothetical protein
MIEHVDSVHALLVVRTTPSDLSSHANFLLARTRAPRSRPLARDIAIEQSVPVLAEHGGIPHWIVSGEADDRIEICQFRVGAKRRRTTRKAQ